MHRSNSFARAISLCIFCLSFTYPACAVDVEFKAVGDGIFAYIGETEGRTYDNEGLNANIGLIVTPVGAVLVDSGASFQSAKKIHEAAKKVSTQPIKWVINTGGQDHRWLGNGYFASLGIEAIAHSEAKADMNARSEEHLVGLKVLRERLDGTVPTLPARWITNNDSRLELGGVIIEIKHRGGGHTPGDTMVWLPQRNLLFSGDIVYVDRVLGMHAVSKSKTWLTSFAEIDALNPAVIVPGHGGVTNLDTARRHTRDLLQALRTHMKKAVDGDGDMNAAIKNFNYEPFAHLKHAQVWLPQVANAIFLEVERE